MQPMSRSQHTVRNPWVAAGGVSAGARLRLFCLPPAGSGATIYRSWMERLAPEIDVVPVTFPGREMRFAEPPIARLDVLTEMACRPAFPALIGLMRCSATRWERYWRTGWRTGWRPNASASRSICSRRRTAPRVLGRGPELHRLPPDEFWQLANYDGMPREVIENRELRDVLEPLLRAAFSVVATAGPTPKAMLSCPVPALGGAAAHSIAIDELAAWRHATAGTFELLTLPGHHFFISNSQELLLRIVAERLRHKKMLA